METRGRGGMLGMAIILPWLRLLGVGLGGMMDRSMMGLGGGMGMASIDIRLDG